MSLRDLAVLAFMALIALALGVLMWAGIRAPADQPTPTYVTTGAR